MRSTPIAARHRIGSNFKGSGAAAKKSPIAKPAYCTVDRSRGESCLAPGLLLAFAAGELRGAELERVETAIDECSLCRSAAAAAALGSGEPGDATVTSESRLREALPDPGLPVGDRYRVIRRLGTGGMGIVSLAEDKRLARNVALKVLTPRLFRGHASARVRMVREAQAMAQLDHANVVRIFDIDDRSGGLFVAMEYVDGTDLAKWLRQAKPSANRIVDAFCQAGRGLAAAHACGIVHRDFKPSNALINSEGVVKVTDFGLARADSSTSPELLQLRITTSGALLGTPRYMSPEQFRRGIADERSDQFSLCLSLAESLGACDSLAGAREGTGGAPSAVAAELAAAGISRSLCRAVTRGLEADPDSRFAGISDLVVALERANRGRRRLLVSAAVALSVALIAALAIAASC